MISLLTWMYRYSPSNSVKFILPLLSVSKMSARQSEFLRCQLESSLINCIVSSYSAARTTSTHHLHAVLSSFYRLIFSQQPLQVERVELTRAGAVELVEPAISFELRYETRYQLTYGAALHCPMGVRPELSAISVCFPIAAKAGR